MNNKPREEVKFEPWTGCRYGSENSLGLPKRLLVLGESHYGDIPRRTITQEFVKTVMEGQATVGRTFFTRLYHAFCGPGDDRRMADFCRAIAYYNFIQEMMATPGDPSKHAYWGAAKGPFFECLERLKPSHVVACGFTLWRNLPDDESFSCLPPAKEQDFWDQLPERGRRSREEVLGQGCWIGRYKYTGGSCVSLRILHPSSIGKHFFRPCEWHPVLQRFFKLQAD